MHGACITVEIPCICANMRCSRGLEKHLRAGSRAGVLVLAVKHQSTELTQFFFLQTYYCGHVHLEQLFANLAQHVSILEAGLQHMAAQICAAMNILVTTGGTFCNQSTRSVKYTQYNQSFVCCLPINTPWSVAKVLINVS